MNEPAPGTDKTVPSVARAYDFVLGGKDNYDVDRKFAQSIIDVDPGIVASAKMNKEFGRRVVDYMARQGVKQFLDLGSGIPTSPPSVHDTARRVHPDSRVVYVDHDPVVNAHNRALRAIGPGLVVIQQSFLEPETIFEHPDFLDCLDTDQPIGILILSVFQNTLDEDFVGDVMARIRGRLAPGSHIAISHFSARSPQYVKDQIDVAVERHGYPAVKLRSDEEMEALFEGLTIVPPGLVELPDWYFEESDGDDRPDLSSIFTGAVGRVDG